MTDNIIFLGFGFDSVNISKLNHAVTHRRPGAVIRRPYKPFEPRSKRVTLRGPDRFEDISVFEGKKLYATGKDLNETQRENVKKMDGLKGLKFVNYDLIYEYLNACVDEYL